VSLVPEPAPPILVVMSLYPQYYDLILHRRKRHEFRRHFLPGTATRWFVYLTDPVGALTAVIDLAPAILDTPAAIAEIAEQVQPGNGASVLEYLGDVPLGYAMPILRVREYPPMPGEHLADIFGRPPTIRRYTLVDKNRQLAALCAQFTEQEPIRDLDIEHQRPT
jgi:predicted transcriptional regulator